MEKCKPVVTPPVVNQQDRQENVDGKLYRSVIQSLFCLTTTRPYLMFVATLLSRFMQSPSQAYFVAVKRVLRYIK